MNDSLTTTTQDIFVVTDNIEKLAKYIAEAQMYGITTPAQAVTLLMLSHEEHKTLSQMMREVHCFPDGKIAQKANYTQGAFQAAGNTIIFHVRTPEMVAATFVMGKADDACRERAVIRFTTMWKLDGIVDPLERSKLILEIAKLSRDGEETIIRTRAEAIESGIAKNAKGEIRPVWNTSKRQMLTARCVTEGIGVVDPARAAGLYSEDEVVQIQVEEQLERTPEERTKLQADELVAKAALVNGAEKSRLLGLASDLRVELDAKKQLEDHKKEPVVPGESLPGLDGNVSEPRPEPQQAPAVVADAEPVDRAESKPKPAVEAPAEPDWRHYKLQGVKAPSYKGRALEELRDDELELLYEKRSVPFLESTNEVFAYEAKMLKLAYDNMVNEKASKAKPAKVRK